MNTLLVATGFLQTFGGVQSVERLLHTTLTRVASESGGRHVTCSLRDTPSLVGSAPTGFGNVVGVSGLRLGLVRDVAWHFLRLRPRVVVFSHVHLARMAPLLRMLRPRARIAIVAHGIEVWRPLDAVTRLGLRFASAVWCVSEYTARQLARYNGTSLEQVRLLPNAIDVVATSPRRRTDGDPTLLSVCRLDRNERYKGVDLALRAHALLLQEFPRLHFRIVGGGSDLERLQSLVRDLGTEERVTFLGSLPAADLNAEYERCTIFVLPSRKEGFGIVFLEAMGHEKPVVALAAGGTPEVVIDGECGLLIAPNDLLSLYESLRRLLTDAELSRRLGVNGRRRVERFFTAEQFKSRVASLLGGGSEPAGQRLVPGTV